MHQTLIDCETLLAHLGHSDWVIFDCRFDLGDADAKERDYRAGHIPGAIYANLSRDLSGPVIPGKSGRNPLPDPESLHRRFCNWGIGPKVQVVVYDSGPGSFAARLWWSLRWLGHERVAVLEGGWKAWNSQNLPLSTEVPKPVPWRFPLQLQEGWVVDAETILQASTNPEVRLIDGRGADRFRGENETLDPVAGHIPGARSLPSLSNVGKDGQFQDAEELRKKFEGVLAGCAVEQHISYCGSGITACHNLLAMKHAGFAAGRLYPGSWSEWITDPKRPIATGAA